MSSSVYFKFKSQKEPTRVAIDGPHTDVWNLKREIITLSRLGDGSDFDLKIYKENNNEEYTDDTEIIPKDSTVIARRVPAAVPGKGRAARYVSGKPPATAKPNMAARAQATAAMDSAMTEEEKLKAMLKMTDAQWQQKQEEMSHDQRINPSGQRPGKKANVPEGEPPHGYICFRCMKRGHWIQACPTNDDASYDNKMRIKKTTGIPRSMLQKVDQAEIDNLDEQQRQNVMVTSEGEYVLAQADKKTWEKFQTQKNATDQAQKQVQTGDKALQELGLECPIDKRMFVDPMKTPCCGKTYCHECIENALLDNDLECPNCHTANVSLEGLKADEEATAKIQELANKADGSSPAAAGASPKSEQGSNASRPPSPNGTPKSPSSVAGKKRSASEAADTKESLAVPSPMKRQKSGDSEVGTPKSDTEEQSATTPNAAMEQMQAMMQQMQNVPNMPNMNGMNMGMGMPNMMPFGMPNMNMMNPMMMNMMMNNGIGGINNLPNMNGGMPTINAMNTGFSGHVHNQGWNNGQQNQFNGAGRGNGFRNKNFKNQHNNFQKGVSPAPNTPPVVGLENVPKGPKAMSTTPVPGAPTGPKFANQQRSTGNDEEQAYQRAPVNPQRAFSRANGRKGMRNADYKEL